jgi:hypothetical protein
MEKNIEKRMLADTGYEVKQAIRIGDKEVVLAENMKEPEGNYYLVANYTENGIIAEYSQCMIGADFLEILREFTVRLNSQIDSVISELGVSNYQSKPITAGQCYPDDYSQSIDGKVMAIKAGVFRPEYRRGDRQLVLVDGGFGAMGYARGSAVYCYHLCNGEHTRFERHDILGEIKVLPDWAKERLSVIQAEQDIKTQQDRTSPEKIAGYTITERIQVGKKQFVLGENPDAVSPFVTWQHMEGRIGYDLGHYFADRSKALADLHARANRERTGIAPDRVRRSRDDAR